MSLITINADFKQLVVVMDRIAKVLERILLEAYQIRMGHCSEPLADPNPKVAATVDYATDEGLVKEKLIDLFALARQRDLDSDVEQDRDL